MAYLICFWGVPISCTLNSSPHFNLYEGNDAVFDSFPFSYSLSLPTEVFCFKQFTIRVNANFDFIKQNFNTLHCELHEICRTCKLKLNILNGNFLIKIKNSYFLIRDGLLHASSSGR